MAKEEVNTELENLRNSEKHYRILMDESMDPTFYYWPQNLGRF
jgi:hypothetical protein